MKYWKLFDKLPESGDEVYILVSDQISHQIISAKLVDGKFEYLTEIPDGYNKNFFFYAWAPKNGIITEQDLFNEREIAIIEYGKASYDALMERLRSAGLTPST